MFASKTSSRASTRGGRVVSHRLVFACLVSTSSLAIVGCEPPATTDGGSGGAQAGNASGGSNGAGTGSGGSSNQGSGGAMNSGSGSGGNNASASGGSNGSGGSSGSASGGNNGPGSGGNNASASGGNGNGTGSGGAGGPRKGAPGTVVATDAAGTLGCVQLCDGTIPSQPTVNPDWGYEGASCVIKDTPTAVNNQACTTGDPLPTPNRNGLPGAVVGVDSAGTLACVPLCKGKTPSGTDPDWGYEYQASCLIGGTKTANCNQACKTGDPLPAASAQPPRDGLTVDDECVPLCACNSAGTDPSWGWEYQAQCLMPMSVAAAGKLACTAGAAENTVPPALTGTKTHDGFYTSGGRLYDAYGKDFVIRGVNNPHLWFDNSNKYLAYRALDAIASYKTNTIRVVWETTGGTPALLARILYRIVQLKMVPIIELHDATGKSANADLMAMANYYVRADIKKVLNDFRAYLLINIANEWSGTDYANAYGTAIKLLRTNGINHTLVIDANGFGQAASSIFNNVTALMTADTQKNLLFSVHMYGQYGSASAVDAVLNQAVSSSVPLIVGEFGPMLAGASVAWQEVMAKCQASKLGYIPWSWKGNTGADVGLDMATDWPGPLTTWGQNVMVNDPNSIQRTSARASIFN